MPQPGPPTSGEPQYEAFYGLREQPFAISTDPRFLFLGGSHRRAYDELLTGLRRREGLLLLTGETGTGKTTLCRAVIDALGPRTFSALILNPYMSDVEVLRVILRDFGLVSRDEIRRGAFAKSDTPQLLDTLEGFLRSLLPLNSRAVLVIDEAQSLSPQVLDQIRILGGYESDGQRLLQIVLVGQPTLGETLKTEPMRALNERVTRRTALLPLPLAEIDEYIRHRLTVAGGDDRVTFTPEAIRLLMELSRGLPRRINVLCDRVLGEGQISGSHEIRPELVKRAALSIAGTTAPEVSGTPPAAPPKATPLWESDEVAVVPTQSDRVEVPFNLGAELAPRSAGRRWLIVSLAVLTLVAAGAAGGYAWMFNAYPPEIPPLPNPPKLAVPPALQGPTMPQEWKLRDQSAAPESIRSSALRDKGVFDKAGLPALAS